MKIYCHHILLSTVIFQICVYILKPHPEQQQVLPALSQQEGDQLRSGQGVSGPREQDSVVSPQQMIIQVSLIYRFKMILYLFRMCLQMILKCIFHYQKDLYKM